MSDRYLELLSDFDLRILGAASGMVEPDHAEAFFRAQSARVPTAISSPDTFRALFPSLPPTAGRRAGSRHPTSLRPAPGKTQLLEPAEVVLADGALTVTPSTFLFFAVLVSHGADRLRDTTLRAQRLGSHTFASVADIAGTETASNPTMRLYLAELLDSFSAERATRGWESLHTISPTSSPTVDERSPFDLVALLPHVTAEESAGLFRRLGDVALFRTGLRTRTTEDPELTSEEAALLTTSLPESLRLGRFSATVPELFSNLSHLDVLAELGPIWYRRAAQRIATPTASVPLGTVADQFDDAVGFLQYLVEIFGLDLSPTLQH